MFRYRRTTRADYHIAYIQQIFFFQQRYLILKYGIQVFFLIIEERLHTPAKAQLVDKRWDFGKYIQWRTGAVAGQHKTRTSGLCHAYKGVRFYISCHLAGVIAECIA